MGTLGSSRAYTNAACFSELVWCNVALPWFRSSRMRPSEASFFRLAVSASASVCTGMCLDARACGSTKCMYVPGSYVVSAAAAKSGLSCDCIECMGLDVCDPMRRGFGDGCRIPAVGSGCGCCCVLLLIADEVGAVRGVVAGAGVVDFLCVFCEEEAVV